MRISIVLFFILALSSCKNKKNYKWEDRLHRTQYIDRWGESERMKELERHPYRKSELFF